MFIYTTERELQDHIVENFSEFFDFRYVSQEFGIDNGPKVDLVGEDDSNFYFIELKRTFVDKETVKQVRKYIKAYAPNFSKPIIGIVASLLIKKSAISEISESEDIRVMKLKNVNCTHANDSIKMLRLSEQLINRINNYRRNVGGIPPKSVAIRELIELGLNVFENSIKGSMEGD